MHHFLLAVQALLLRHVSLGARPFLLTRCHCSILYALVLYSLARLNILLATCRLRAQIALLNRGSLVAILLLNRRTLADVVLLNRSAFIAIPLLDCRALTDVVLLNCRSLVQISLLHYSALIQVAALDRSALVRRVDCGSPLIPSDIVIGP